MRGNQKTRRLALAGLTMAAAAGVVTAACSSGGAAAATAAAPRVAATEPVLHTYVGQLADQPGAKVVLLVGRDASEAYVCDDHQVAELLRGTAHQKSAQGTAVLTGAGGATMSASFGAGPVDGSVTLPGRPAGRFVALPARGSAGLYAASTLTAGGLLQGRWIVEPDQQVAGAVKLNGVVVANPTLGHVIPFGSGTLRPGLVARVGNAGPQPVPHLDAISGPDLVTTSPATAGDDGHKGLVVEGTALINSVRVTLTGPSSPPPFDATEVGTTRAFFVMPKLAADGIYQLRVTTAGGTSNSLTLKVVPTDPRSNFRDISLALLRGPSTGGTLLTVFGSGFRTQSTGALPKVDFAFPSGLVEQVPATVVTDTELTVLTPAGPAGATVLVSVEFEPRVGLAIVSNPQPFIYDGQLIRLQRG